MNFNKINLYWLFRFLYIIKLPLQMQHHSIADYQAVVGFRGCMRPHAQGASRRWRGPWDEAQARMHMPVVQYGPGFVQCHGGPFPRLARQTRGGARPRRRGARPEGAQCAWGGVRVCNVTKFPISFNQRTTTISLGPAICLNRARAQPAAVRAHNGINNGNIHR